MIIRKAEEKDIDDCVVMAENFYNVSGYKEHVEFCKETVEGYIKMSLDMGLLSVADNGKGLVGFIGGLSMPCIMNKSFLTGSELAWWVEPEYRKGSVGLKLLDHIENSAKEMGCKMWSMMSLEQSRPDKMEKIYLSKGYKKTENTFTRVF